MKMTDGQRQWLEDLRRGRNPEDRFYGRSGHGGMTKIRASLYRRGWINVANEITDAGKEALQPSAPTRRAGER